MYMSPGQKEDDGSCFWNEPQLLGMVRSKKTDSNYHSPARSKSRCISRRSNEDINSSLIRPSLKPPLGL